MWLWLISLKPSCVKRSKQMHWLSQREINTLREADKLGDKLDEVWMPQSTSSVAEMQKVLADSRQVAS